VSARDGILGRVRATLLKRQALPHPGDFGSWRPAPLEGFRALFEAAGGSYEEVADLHGARAWLARFCTSFPTMSVGRTLPDSLRPDLPEADPSMAGVGISMARAAVAETGSLLMDARDGRRTQLLVPTHVVVLRHGAVFQTLTEALRAVSTDLPSALGLHSGPSKSADIGQIMVKGVHGPGRVVALVVREGEGEGAGRGATAGPAGGT